MGIPTTLKRMSGENAPKVWRAAAFHMSKYNLGRENATATFRGYASD
jgi:hypothetical protein